MLVKFRQGGKPLRNARLGPYAALVPLFLFFVAKEYHRSWEIFYVKHYNNIFQFALERLSLHYSTALNNGAGLLKASDGRAVIQFIHSIGS
jgi:hypothetical protein